MVPWMIIHPKNAVSTSRNPSRVARLVASTRYTEPISTATPTSTERMPRICGSQAMPARVGTSDIGQLPLLSSAVSSATDGAAGGLGGSLGGRLASARAVEALVSGGHPDG